MKEINQAEYDELLSDFTREEMKKANPKPYGMSGTWAWHLKKIKEFDEKLRREGYERMSKAPACH